MSESNVGPASESPVGFVAPPPESLPRKVFIGPSGLRAGWRFAIYTAAFIALTIAISWMLRPLLSPPSSHQVPRLWVFLVGECISLTAAVIPAAFMARLEHRRLGVYGLPRQQAFGKFFWLGLLWGILAITVLLLVMRGIGVFYFGGFALHGLRVLKFALYWAVLFLIVGFFEEFVTRGYTQFTLTDAIGFWPAAILLSTAFGVIHLGNQGEAWIGALAAGFIGLFFCLTLRRTGSLWFAVGMHASWDWGETFFYSVPDSGMVAPGHLLKSSFHGSPWLTGGSVGPEGSVLVFILIAAMWIVFDRMYPNARYMRAGIEDVGTAPVQPSAVGANE
jgi:membrane protease YdiL (CAAX protease family)